MKQVDYFEQNYKKGYDEYAPDKKLLNYISSIKKYKSNGNLLDIGCAYGNFLKLAQNNGYSVAGIEPTDACDTISITDKVKKTFFEPECIDQEWGTFDIITAFDVLEHIPDLDSALKYIDTLLNDNGLFVFVVPVYDGVVGKMVEIIDNDPTHVWKISRYEWIDIVSKNFTVIDKIPHMRIPPLLMFKYQFYEMPQSLFNFSPAIMVICKKR